MTIVNMWKPGDSVYGPSVGLEGQVLRVDGDRVQVWWSDDGVSWERATELRDWPREE